jgi:hypothetical protein
MIKKILALTTMLLLTICAFCQNGVPQLINFQAVARDQSGNIIRNSNIELKMTVREGSATGTAVYCSVYATVLTNDFGSFSIQLNRGQFAAACNGSSNVNFSTIPWETGNKWIQFEYRPTTGSAFLDLGAIELASVPYAFAARTAERLVTPAQEGQYLRYVNGQWVASGSPKKEMVIFERRHSSSVGPAVPTRIWTTRPLTWTQYTSGTTNIKRDANNNDIILSPGCYEIEVTTKSLYTGTSHARLFCSTCSAADTEKTLYSYSYTHNTFVSSTDLPNVMTNIIKGVICVTAESKYQVQQWATKAGVWDVDYDTGSIPEGRGISVSVQIERISDQ